MKEYQREYQKQYSKGYYIKNREKLRKKGRIEHRKHFKEKKAKLDKNKAREYHNNYMRVYSKKEEVKIKQRIRRMTKYYYGKTPKGYHRHHINYDSPHNFILIPIKKHGKIHRKD